MRTHYVHITSIRNRRDVWGHALQHCDASGCAAGADRYYQLVDAEEGECGKMYEISEDGEIVAEIDAEE